MAEAFNHRLEQALAEAGLSRKAAARAVREEAARDGVQLSTDHTRIGKWLDGDVPRGRTPEFLARAIARRIGRPVTPADIRMRGSGRHSADLGLVFAEDDAEGLAIVSGLWQADLDDDPVVVRSEVQAPPWRDAALRWLVGGRGRPATEGPNSERVGLADVAAVRATVQHFADLDNKFGGGHGRRALIQYLHTDARPLLSGRCSDDVRRELFATVSEATLLAGWMSYDSGLHGLGQRYLVQALRLAQAGEDRRLAGSILSAMSHQATFLGRYQEAAELARAGVAGINGVATATLRSQFHAMEARALARLGDQRACEQAMADAVRDFERRVPDEDPEFIRYFDDAELAAELGHCNRDLGRAPRAIEYAGQSLGEADGRFVRSDFFATMVLADARVAAGEIEEACRVAVLALEAGEQLKSARCAAYVDEFRLRLRPFAAHASVRELDERSQGHSLWRPQAP